jgi:hypothetical protein
MRFPYNADYAPPAPTVDGSFAVLGEPFMVGPLRALLDSGADVSLVPRACIARLGVPPSDRKYLRSHRGERRRVDVHFVDVGIGELRLPFIEVVAHDLGSEVILGRNVLSKPVVRLDGPARIVDSRE